MRPKNSIASIVNRLSGKPIFFNCFPRKRALIAHVVNREDHRQVLHGGVLGILGPQKHRHQARLPVVAVNQIGHPHALAKLDGRAGKFAEAFRVVRIIFSRRAIELIAVEIFRIVHEIVADSVQAPALGNRRETHAAAHGNRKAGHGNLIRAGIAVPGKQHGDVMAAGRQRPGQRFDDVRQTARFRKWQPFGATISIFMSLSKLPPY